MAKTKQRIGKHILVGQGDYLVVAQERKRLLVQVVAKTGDRFRVVVDNENRAHPELAESLEVPRGDVVANLGPQPAYGRAYGTLVEPYISTSRIKPWGDVHWFVELAPSDAKTLTQQLELVGKALRRSGLVGHLPLATHIRNPQGRVGGSYLHRADPEAVDVLTFRPQGWSAAECDYYIWHEFGHHLQAFHFNPRMHARWISLYHANVRLQRSTVKDLERARRDFVNGAGTVKQYRAELAEDAQPLFDACIEYITGTHGLRTLDLDLLLEAKRSHVRPYWPDDPMQLSEWGESISEYALKNASEYWCEALGYTMSGREVPKPIAAAVHETLASCKDR